MLAKILGYRRIPREIRVYVQDQEHHEHCLHGVIHGEDEVEIYNLVCPRKDVAYWVGEFYGQKVIRIESKEGVVIV